MIWDPFEDLAKMHEEVDKLFSRTFGKKLLGSGKSKDIAKYEGFRAPVSDIRETENSVVATFELPGADKKDIELNVTDTHVEVKVQKKAEKEVKKKGSYSYESRSQQYYRALPLPAEVKSQDTKATYKDGLLRIEIPKTKKLSKKKKILIE